MQAIQLSLLSRLLTKPVATLRRKIRLIPRTRTPKLKRSRKIQSDPQLHSIWQELRKEYFPERGDLDGYTIYWSTRDQTRTLASCNTRGQRVVVARELDLPKHHPWLKPLLYHEMCHAYLGENVSRRGSSHLWHGKEFRALERRHPEIKALDAWIRSGGWLSAVRSHRTRRFHERRKGTP